MRQPFSEPRFVELRANLLFRTEGQPSQSKELLKKNLMLILDWNRPDIAISEIFQRDSSSKLDIEKFMFEKALLKKDREEFIEIFLDQGFQIHRFLNHIKMFLLFEKCEDREFFLNVCMERGMGVTLVRPWGVWLILLLSELVFSV